MPSPFQHRQFEKIDSQSIDASGWLPLFNALTASRFYHHPDWFLAIDQHLTHPPLSVSVIEKDSEAVALFVWQGHAGQRRPASPRHDHLSLGDALIHHKLTPAEQAAAIECLSVTGNGTQWDWRLHNVPAHSPLIAAIKQQELSNCRLARTSAWFDLSDETVPPTGKLKRNLNRLDRKLEQQGRVSMQWISASDELPDAFTRFTALEASGWKAKGQKSTAIAHNPELLGFYEQLLSPRYAGLKPIITLLWLDDLCIGAQYALQTENTLSLLKIAYDEQFSGFSPGSLLLYKVIGAAVEKGLESVSLVTSPQWAERWHPRTEPVWHVTRYANNAGGLTMRAMDHLKQSARNRLKPAA